MYWMSVENAYVRRTDDGRRTNNERRTDVEEGSAPLLLHRRKTVHGYYGIDGRRLLSPGIDPMTMGGRSHHWNQRLEREEEGSSFGGRLSEEDPRESDRKEGKDRRIERGSIFDRYDELIIQL